MRANAPGLARLVMSGCPLLREPDTAAVVTGVTTSLRDTAAAKVAAHRGELVDPHVEDILGASGLMAMLDAARTCEACGTVFAGAGTKAVQFCPVGGLRVPIMYDLCSFACRARVTLGFGVSQRRSVGFFEEDQRMMTD